MIARNEDESGLSDAFIIAALLFVATIYAPFAIAALMPTVDSAGVADSFRLSAILVTLSMAVGTVLGTRLTGMSLVLAPAVGLTAFFAQGRTLLDVPQLYWSGVGAGVLVIVCNLGGDKSIRFHVLNEMRPEIRAGVAGGIGALLAEGGRRIITDDARMFDWIDGFDQRIAILLAGATCVAIFAGDTYAEKLEETIGLDDAMPKRYYLAKSAYVLAPALTFAILAILTRDRPALEARPTHGIEAVLAGRCSALLHPEIHIANGVCMMVFALVIAFVILTDIVGTPFQMLDPTRLRPEGRELKDSPAGKQAITRSFYADALMIFANAAVALPPSVFYAENYVRYNYRFERSAFARRPALIYALLLLAVAGSLIAFDLPLARFSGLARVAAAPVLLMIGIQVIATSIRADTNENPSQSNKAVPIVSERDPLKHMATGMIIILSPFVGLEWSLPLGIATFAIRNKVLGKEMSWVTAATGAFSVFVVLVMTWVTFGPG